MSNTIYDTLCGCRYCKKKGLASSVGIVLGDTCFFAVCTTCWTQGPHAETKAEAADAWNILNTESFFTEEQKANIYDDACKTIDRLNAEKNELQRAHEEELERFEAVNQEDIKTLNAYIAEVEMQKEILEAKLKAAKDDYKDACSEICSLRAQVDLVRLIFGGRDR